MFEFFTQIPMDTAVSLSLVTLGVSLVMSLIGLMRAMKPTGVRHAR